MYRIIQHIFAAILFTCLILRELTASSSTSNWTKLSSLNSPEAREFASMAFDPIFGKLILFGGNLGSDFFNETWYWNGNNWIPLPSNPLLLARTAASMAFDPCSGQLILFGGFNSNIFPRFFSDTWNWNGTDWMPLFPSITPPPRVDASMAFDSATGQLILFGGFNSTGFLKDTWNWNGINWELLNPDTSPTAREGASMAYDHATGQLILFGGLSKDGYLNETWKWDGSNWIQLFPTSPSARFQTSMSFDPVTGRLILFGGCNGSEYFNDTWIWDGANWTQLTFDSPSSRSGASMAFYTAAQQLILFGGYNGTNNAYFNDTWVCATSPLPVANASPSNLSICSGANTNISLSSDVHGTTFSWTVLENGVAGGSNGSGSTISQILTTTGNSPGTAIYTITPTYSEFSGSPITAIVTINPIPTAFASPSILTIPSGIITSISLSSDLPDTTFNWSISQSNVVGGSNGSGSTIAQTLRTIGGSTGTAAYTITPTSALGISGPPINVTVTVQPVKKPRSFRGEIKRNKFATKVQNPKPIKKKRNAHKLKLHKRSADKQTTKKLLPLQRPKVNQAEFINHFF